MVTPLTTPSAKLSANTLTQVEYAANHFWSPLVRKRSLKNSSSQARAIVIAGNRIWKLMLAANWMRASRTASSIGDLLAGFAAAPWQYS